MWQGWSQYGNSYAQNTKLTQEVLDVYRYFASKAYLDDPWTWDGTTNATAKLGRPSQPFVHYFNTTGILQHNDNGPGYHPTDVGHIKVAAHLIRYINIKFGWDLYATAAEYVPRARRRGTAKLLTGHQGPARHSVLEQRTQLLRAREFGVRVRVDRRKRCLPDSCRLCLS